MLGYIIKFGLLAIVVMVGLNSFAPVQANKVLASVSEFTNIDEKILKKNLDIITKFTEETIEEVSQKVQKNLAQ